MDPTAARVLGIAVQPRSSLLGPAHGPVRGPDRGPDRGPGPVGTGPAAPSTVTATVEGARAARDPGQGNLEVRWDACAGRPARSTSPCRRTRPPSPTSWRRRPPARLATPRRLGDDSEARAHGPPSYPPTEARDAGPGRCSGFRTRRPARPHPPHSLAGGAAGRAGRLLAARPLLSLRRRAREPAVRCSASARLSVSGAFAALLYNIEQYRAI